MYADRNFKTKKEFKAAVDAYLLTGVNPVRLYAPGFGTPATDGHETVEGPHFPKPHTWYATVSMKGGIVIKVT